MNRTQVILRALGGIALSVLAAMICTGGCISYLLGEGPHMDKEDRTPALYFAIGFVVSVYFAGRYLRQAILTATEPNR